MSELKPCPHCNVVPEIIGGGVFAFCHCYAEEYEDGPFDINIWNTRPIEDALRAENAKLRAALESLRQNGHYECDDTWYSCPKHPEYCGDDDRNHCNCGTDATNAIIDAALKGE